MKLITLSALIVTGFALSSCGTASSIGNAAGGALQATGNAVGSAANSTVNAGRNLGGAVRDDVSAAGRAVTGN